MNFHSNRQLGIFLALLEANQAMTSEKLAVIAKTSVRTVKEEIQVLKAIVKKAEMNIVSKPGYGYFLTYDNAEKYQQLKDEMLIKYRSANTIPTDLSQRVNYIIRRLLSASDYIKIEDFANELFINRRAIAKEMKMVHKMLEYYGIQVATKPGYGIRIRTDEYHLRVCMVDYFEFYFHKIEPSFLAKGFLEAFDFDFDERLQIRKLFMENLIEQNVIVPDYCAQKIVIHLLLMRSRVRRGCCLQFAEADVVRIRNFPEYLFAQKIIQELTVFANFDLLNEQETIYLAILLATGKDMLEHANTCCYTDFYLEAVATYDLILAEFRREYQLNLEEYDCFKQDMLHILVAICIKSKYDIKEIQGSPTRINHIGRNILQSPVCVTLAFDIISLIEARLAKKVSEYDALNISYLVYNLVDSVELEYIKANLIIIAENSKLAIRSMEKKLRKRLGNSLDCIDILEVYELRKTDLTGYDGILTAHVINNFAFPLELYKVSYFLETKDYQRIVNDIILRKQNWQKSLPRFSENNLYRRYAIDSMTVFFKMLSFKHFNGQAEGDAFFNKYIAYAEQFKVRSYNQVLVICHLGDKRSEDILEVFEFEKNLAWNDGVVKYAVFISVNVKDFHTLKLVEMMTRLLEQDNRYVHDILYGHPADIYTKMLEECAFLHEL